MNNRMFEDFDDVYEVVESSIDAGQYVIRFRQAPYAGIGILPKTFKLTAVEDSENMVMDIDYDILEPTTVDPDVLEKDPVFQLHVARAVLNMYERTMSSVIEPEETITNEDGTTDVVYRIENPEGITE